MRRILFLTLVAFLTTVAKTSGQDMRWQWNSGSKITMHAVVLPSGNLLVSSEERTVLLSPDSSKVLWSRDDIVSCQRTESKTTCSVNEKREFFSFFGRYLRFETIAGDGIPARRMSVFARDTRFLLVDGQTGLDAFDTSSIGFQRVSGTCLVEGVLITWDERGDSPALGAGFELSMGKTLWTKELPISKDMACLPVTGSPVWLAYGKTGGKESGVFALESSTGNPLWESHELAMDGWVKDPLALALNDSAAIVYVAKNGGPKSVDLRTGAVQWRAGVFRGEDPVGIEKVDGRDKVVIRSAKRLAALDPGSGAVVWSQDKFPQSARVMDMTPRGLLVENDGVNLLDYETGKLLWPETRHLDPGASLMHADHLLQVSNKKKKVFSLALNDGSQKELGTIDLKGGESAAHLELLDDVLIVRSTQNLVALELNGSIRYQRFYPAPGLSFGQQVVDTLVAIGASMLSEYAARSQAEYTARIAALASGGSSTVWYIYEVYSPNLSVRFPSTADTELFVYMYSEDSSQGKGFNLVRLDKRTGDEAGRLRLQERRPSYSINPTTNDVIVKTGENELTAYAFQLRK